MKWGLLIPVVVVVLKLYFKYGPKTTKDYFYCSRCGNRVHKDASSCKKCGAKFSDECDIQTAMKLTHVYES